MHSIKWWHCRWPSLTQTTQIVPYFYVLGLPSHLCKGDFWQITRYILKTVQKSQIFPSPGASGTLVGGDHHRNFTEICGTRKLESISYCGVVCMIFLTVLIELHSLLMQWHTQNFILGVKISFWGCKFNKWHRWIRSHTLGLWLWKMVSVWQNSVPGSVDGRQSGHHCRKYGKVTAYRFQRR